MIDDLKFTNKQWGSHDNSDALK